MFRVGLLELAPEPRGRTRKLAALVEGGLFVDYLSKVSPEWAKSVGNVAAPLLAGFSLTSVIVVSEDAGKFRWGDAAIVSLAIAAVALIVAVQCSKYVHWEYRNILR
jgi:hypothetical protein